MASVVINGDTSGSVTLSAPAVAGTVTVTLPAASGTMATTAGLSSYATLATPSFTTTIGVGAATASASGSGITFPATQSASSDANTLDDYEEGTWTPADASGASLSLSSGATASYIKVGRMVTVNVTVNYPSTGSGSAAKISGLPFTSHNGIYYGAVRGISTSITAPVIQIGGSSTTIEFFLSGNGGSTVTNANLSSTSPYASITYITAS